MKTSGAFLLQKKSPDSFLGTANSGVDEQGSGYIRLSFLSIEGTLWLCSDRIVRIHRSLAIEFSAVLRILVASTCRLDGFDATFRPSALTTTTSPLVCSVGPTRDGIFECSFEGVDPLQLLREDDTYVLILATQVAQAWSEGLTQELARIASWSDP